MKTECSDFRHKQMTEEPIRRLMLRVGIPSGLAMVMTALYSLADSLFVSRLGTEAGAAVGVCFGIQATVQAVSYTLGVGAGSLLSRKLGEKEFDVAARYARLAFLWAFLSGIAIMGIGLLWGDGLLRFLGASESILPHAKAYSRNLLFAAPLMCMAFVFSQLLRAEGRALASMLGILCGSLCNVALDPIFIFQCGFGIAGASLATMISQAVACVIPLIAYLYGNGRIGLFGRIFAGKSLPMTGKILVAGLPSSARQGLMALATVLLNHAASNWGSSAVAAMSVVGRIFLLVYALCLGVGQGMMPVTGYNYGDGNIGRVRSAYRIAMLASTLLMLAAQIPVFIFSTELIGLFRNEPEVIDIGTRALRAQSSVFVLHGIITCTNMLLQSLGKSFGATLLACARQGIFFVPLIWLLPFFGGVESVIWVQPIADGFTFLFTIPFLIYASKLLRNQKETAAHSSSLKE